MEFFSSYTSGIAFLYTLSLFVKTFDNLFMNLNIVITLKITFLRILPRRNNAQHKQIIINNDIINIDVYI